MTSFAAIATGTGEQTVPAGAYTAAKAIIHNTVTSSSDYLILVAQGANPASNTYPCTVDSTTAAFQLSPGTRQFVMVGWRTIGLFDMQGSDTWCMYGDHYWSVDSNVRTNIQTWTGIYNAPRACHMVGSTRNHHIGCTFHDCATIILMSQNNKGANAVDLRGIYGHDLYPSQVSTKPGVPDKWHSDCIAENGGNSQVTCTDSTFAPQYKGGATGLLGGRTGGGIHQEGHTGPSTNKWVRIWMVGSANQSWENTGNPGLLDVTFDTCHEWGANGNPSVSFSGNVNPHYAHGSQGADILGQPASPAIGSNDPAFQWRAANPFVNWRSLLPFLGAASAPGAPISVTASPGNGLVVVNFSAPVSDGGAGIDQYRATLTPGGTTQTGASNVRQLSLTATNGTSYTATVAAHNSVGYGPESSPSNAVTPASATVPGTPSITLLSIGDTYASFAWTQPPANGGTIDAFRMTLVWTVSGGGTITRDFPGDALGGTVTGLVASRPYTVAEVKAHNSAGYGSNSAPVSFSTLASVVVKHWSDSLAVQDGTTEYWDAATQTANWNAAIADITGIGPRYDLNIETFRSNATTADAVINRMTAAGYTDLLIIVNHLGGGTWPNHSLASTYVTAATNLSAHYRTLVGGSVRLNYELINEHNFNMTPRSEAEFAFWCKQLFTGLKAGDSTCFVGTGGRGHAATNKPPSPTIPQVSNIYGQPYDSSQPQQWSSTDGVADHCNTAVVGAGNRLQDVAYDFIGVHPYSNLTGPLDLIGAPAGINTPNVVVNGMRELSRIDTILTSFGIATKLWWTEVGQATSPCWVLGTHYPVDFILFDNQGTPNGDLWHRPQISICTTAHDATQGNRPSAPGSPWRACTQADIGRLGYNTGFEAVGSLATENEAGLYTTNTIRILMEDRADADGRLIRNRYERLYFFTQRDLPTAPGSGVVGFRYGLYNFDGSPKGQPASSGPRAAVAALAGRVDTRGAVIVSGAGWEAIGSIPTDLP